MFPRTSGMTVDMLSQMRITQKQKKCGKSKRLLYFIQQPLYKGYDYFTLPTFIQCRFKLFILLSRPFRDSFQPAAASADFLVNGTKFKQSRNIVVRVFLSVLVKHISTLAKAHGRKPIVLGNGNITL